MMQTKILEVRDRATFIPMLCVDMNPAQPIDDLIDQHLGSTEGTRGRWYLLRRCGYSCDGQPNIAMTPLRCDGDRCSNDPHFWGDRTRAVAHDYIISHWNELKDGDVVDVQFILGETKEPSVSERVEEVSWK